MSERFLTSVHSPLARALAAVALAMVAAALGSAVTENAKAASCMAGPPARPNGIVNPCVYRVQMVGNTLHFGWTTFGGGDWNFYNVHRAQVGYAWEQVKINS